MDDARLDHLRIIVSNVVGQHPESAEAASLDLEALVDAGELTIRDVAWLIEQVDRPDVVTGGSIDWHVKPTGPGIVTFTMRSSVKPTTWLSMYLDRAGWEEIKSAADAEMAKAMTTVKRCPR